ncbi:hypothetical protein RF11_12420 [Thelohanellus kitauei]|uniref:Uncharacterized protein n=1 Tax=Thelohanellus kitauei TaxID=669202 RepID=A0A0C2JSA9_THEKT|nr:hypothetical protein RF11_12420 [Thelohanellus kitauei]
MYIPSPHMWQDLFQKICEAYIFLVIWCNNKRIEPYAGQRISTVTHYKKVITQLISDSLDFIDLQIGGKGILPASDFGYAGYLAFFAAHNHDLMENIFVDTSWRPLNFSFTVEKINVFLEVDNVRFHKTNRVQTLLQEKGRTVIYLPPY